MPITLEPRWCPFCFACNNTKVDLSLVGVACSVCGHTVTCDTCDDHDCEFRDDPYNTDGDCLRLK